MVKITHDKFSKVYNQVKERAELEFDQELIDFKTHPYVEKHENYKYAVLEQAKDKLLTKFWNEDEFGNGKITEAVKNSIQTTATYNYKSYQNNLIDWRKKDDFKKLKTDYTTEKLLFEFFKNKIPDEDAFKRFMEFGFSYQLIAYLFFIKNSQKFMPISQQQFDRIFESLDIKLQTSGNISWENYLTYNNVIKGFQKHLSNVHRNITLLDAHSLLWMYGFRFDDKDQDDSKQEAKEIEVKNQKSHKEKDDPVKAPVDEDELPSDFKEIDFLEHHRHMMEIGELAEDFVIEHEKQKLKVANPELADKVRSVSKEPHFGFDILSYEELGKQMQIEVKAVSSVNGKLRFIITRNELKKSKNYPNYYIYCVSNVKSSNPPSSCYKEP